MRTAGTVTADEDLPPELREHLWHTTLPHRYEAILRTGSIVPNPNIPDSERWKTSGGPKYYPYVRVLGGVSLFDFRSFDPVAYSEKYPISSWREFVPYRRDWGSAIWLQIDRSQIGSSFIDADTLVAKWKEDNAYGHTIMPRIEAAHIGPLSLCVVTRVLQVGKGGAGFRDLPCPSLPSRT